MNDLNISLKQLRYYLVAAKHDSLRQAARELRITQPSLSAQLKALENSLGVILFERSRGGVSVTPVGRELLPEARAAVNAARAIIDAAEFATRGPSGTFRLGVSRSLGPYALPWILPALHQEYKAVKFFVREAVPDLLSQGLDDGEYDLIFSTLPIDNPGFVVMPLFREPIYLVTNARHPLAANRELDASQLKGLEILTIEEHHLFHKQVEDLSRRFQARLLRDYEGTSLDAIRQMVYMEMGVAFLPGLYIRSEIRDRNELSVMRIRGEPIYRIHALAWRSTSPLKSFYSKLGQVFQQEVNTEFGDDVVLV